MRSFRLDKTFNTPRTLMWDDLISDNLLVSLLVLGHLLLLLLAVTAVNMTKNSAENSVAERRLRPIYDWLDNGNNKKALQEADKVLKKQPDFQCCRVLKCLALIRLGKEGEAETILNKVHYHLLPQDLLIPTDSGSGRGSSGRRCSTGDDDSVARAAAARQDLLDVRRGR